MRKKLWLVLSLVLVLPVIGLAGCDNITSPPSKAGGIYNNQSTGIWVSGDGKVTAVPDVAVLTLGVATQANTVDQAQNLASTSMNAVISALKSGGIAEKDIKTQVFNIQQLTRYDDKTQQQIVIGYSVTNSVTVKVRNVANTGTVIDSAAKAGGDYTRINNISFTVDDPTPYETSARQMAMADAKAKAKQLADLAGVKLGNPSYISESGGYYPLQGKSVNASAPAASPTPISPGTTDITLTVQVTYSIR